MKQIVFIVILFVFVECQQEDAFSSIAFQQHSYPLKVGNWWRYQVTHAFQETDTIRLNIIRQTNQQETKIYYCEIEKFGVTVDSGQFLLSNNELTYQGLNPRQSLLGEFRVQLPFYQGDVWKKNSKDSTEVISFHSNYEILGKKYEVYYLLSTYRSATHSIIHSFQLAKGTGLVAQHINTYFNGFSQRERFQLIDCSIIK